ncbi:Ribonuclease 3 [bacterium HR36]|uniref:Ribonuclease 3 n=1 Tax=uncultured Planctomycetota bacterium TaxID=120965 RepID=H5SII4_9BACT|nr:ribonuclease III [uncultured Planctomycetota bacterium]GBD37142.1 Ribonuclease 3 [bacterium HR36]
MFADSAIRSTPPATVSSPDAWLQECQEAIGYRFENLELLRAALTHVSMAASRLGSNERLEFLGDAVLGLIVCERLYEKFPEYLEGELTKLKSFIVSRRVCAQVAQTLQLERFLRVGAGVGRSGSVPANLLGDVFEAIIGAIYLDGGLEAAKEWVLRHMGPIIDHIGSTAPLENAKSLLQHLAQKQHGVTPKYEVVDEKGPEHSKCFLVAAVVGEQRFPPAWGRSKKEAEQKAAANALARLHHQPLPYPSQA